MSDQNEQSNIVEFEKLKFPAIEYGVTEAQIAEVAERYKEPDASTDEGYERCKEGCKVLRAMRTAVETRRLDLKRPITEWVRVNVDVRGKELIRQIRAAEGPVREEKERIDEIKQAEALEAAEAEQKRIESIHERIGDIRDSVARVHAFGIPDVKQIKKEIKGLEHLQIDDSFGEFADEASDAKVAAVAKLREVYAAAIVRDEDNRKRIEEQAALDKQREEQEATEKRQREAEEALEKKAREAEARKAAEEKEAQEKADREEADRTAAEDKRIGDIKFAIEVKRTIPIRAEGSSSSYLYDIIASEKANPPTEAEFAEFLPDAKITWQESIDALEVMAKDEREHEAKQRHDEEARLPDKEKLTRWCDAIAAIPEPEVLNDKAQKILRRCGDDLSKFVVRLRADIGKL